MMKNLNIRNVLPDELAHLLALNQSNLPHVGSISLREMQHLHRQAICFRVTESTTTRSAGGLDFTAIGGKRQGHAVPQSLRAKPGAKHPVWKAQLNGQTTGFLIAFGPQADYGSLNFLWFKKRYPDFVYIDRIIIAAEARRKGIAFALYRDLENFAAQRNIPLMACEYNLRPQNEISRQFHQRYGFKEVGTQDTENGKKTVSLQIKQVVRQ